MYGIVHLGLGSIPMIPMVMMVYGIFHLGHDTDGDDGLRYRLVGEGLG